MKGIHTPTTDAHTGPAPARAVPAAGILLARDPAAAARARHYVTGFLAGHVPDDVSEVAELITSELVTNAIKYGRGRLRLLIDIHRRTGASQDAGAGVGQGAGTGTVRTVRLTVADQSPYVPLPAPQPAGTDRESGRGLLLVDALSTRWGHRPVGHTPAAGTAVWAEVDTPA